MSGVWRALLALVVPLALLLGAATGAAAAEVLQVRTATLLQVGDQNRSYSVALACVDLAPAGLTSRRPVSARWFLYSSQVSCSRSLNQG